MLKRFLLIVTAVLIVGALVGAASASATTRFGNSCEANSIIEGDILVQESNAVGDALPVAAPISGILTSWTININAPELPLNLFAQTLKVLRPTGPGHYLVVSENVAGIGPGSNVFPARIPVQAGDHLGLIGIPETFYCETDNSEEVFGFSESTVGIGGTLELEGSQDELGVPVSATVEPDADHDGYGDETQDACPQSAAYQTPCPVIVLGANSLAGKKAVTVTVASSFAAPVGVTATVKLGKGKTATLTAAPQTVSPGQLAKFKLAFNGKVKTRLRELKPSQKLTMTIAASATNVAGVASSAASAAKLKGQAKG